MWTSALQVKYRDANVEDVCIYRNDSQLFAPTCSKAFVPTDNYEHYLCMPAMYKVPPSICSALLVMHRGACKWVCFYPCYSFYCVLFLSEQGIQYTCAACKRHFDPLTGQEKYWRWLQGLMRYILYHFKNWNAFKWWMVLPVMNEILQYTLNSFLPPWKYRDSINEFPLLCVIVCKCTWTETRGDLVEHWLLV